MKYIKNKIQDFILIIFLLPLSWIWEWVYKVRRFCYNYGLLKQNKFRVPIISVGNLTFGGTGKTPFTLWLSDYFATLDKNVMILMRGYKGKLEHSSGILKGGKRLGFNPFDYGDEPLLLARRLKKASVVVGKNRSENLDYYYDREEPDVVVLDDGHQHLKLKRNLNIVLFDALMPLSRYKVAPMGYLREGLSALKDADLVVIGRVDQVPTQKVEKLKELISSYVHPKTPFALIRYRPTGLYNGRYQQVLTLGELQGSKVICVAGIASPTSFFNLVDTLGAKIISKEVFPDHHYFRAEEVRLILERAQQEDALIVTTEKDMVKMRRIVDSERILYLEVKVDFIAGEKETKEAVSKAFPEDSLPVQ